MPGKFLPFLIPPEVSKAFPLYPQVNFFQQAGKTISIAQIGENPQSSSHRARQVERVFTDFADSRMRLTRMALTGEYKAKLQWPPQPRRSNGNCRRTLRRSAAFSARFCSTTTRSTPHLKS